MIVYINTYYTVGKNSNFLWTNNDDESITIV